MRMKPLPAAVCSTTISQRITFSKLLVVLGLFALFSIPQMASANALVAPPSVTLAWDRSPSTDVVGYRVYLGPASRRYTNSVYVGNVTSNVISGLTSGVFYYLAVTAIDATGLESDFSSEVTYSPAGPKVEVRVAGNRQAVLTVSGPVGQAYDLLATTNLTTWSALGSATVESNGLASFTDTAAPNYRLRYYRAQQTP